MQSLNLPPVDLAVRLEDTRRSVFDTVRQIYVPLTEEEWVRQHFVHFLINYRNVPAGLIAIEKSFDFQGMTRRADIVVYSREGSPWLTVECKAMDVSLTQKVFEQVGRYNYILGAPYIGVTNGMEHFCFTASDGEISFLSDFPGYNQ